MRHLLWICAAVNLLMFSLLDGLQLLPMILCFLVGVLVCVAVAYFGARNSDSRSANLRVILASVFAVPLCIVLLWYLFVIIFHWLAPQVHPPEILFLFFFGAYYIVPSYLGIAYIIVSIGFLGFALYHHTFSLYKWTLSFYTAVVLCFVVYILWWYLTGQKWGYL